MTYTLPNGQPHVKKIRDFVYSLGGDWKRKQSLYYEWILYAHIQPDPFKFFKNKFPEFPNKFIRKLIYTLSIKGD